MIIIKRNAITSISASSADAAYPATNLLNDSPKKKWKAASSSVSYAYLDVVTSGTTGALGMVGIVAESVFVTITDPNGIVWQSVVWPAVDWDLPPEGVVVTQEMIDDLANGYQSVWVSFPEFTDPVSIRIELRKTAGTPMILAAGVLHVGQPTEISGVQYPLNEGLEDYSIQRQLSNGATYYKRRDIVRTFSGSIRLQRTEFQSLFRDVARVYGGQPLMIQLAPPWGSEFTVYGRLSAMPSGAHDMPTHSTIQFQITEEL